MITTDTPVIRHLMPALLLTLAMTGTVSGSERETTPANPGLAEVELTPLKATYSATMDKGISINGSATLSLTHQEDGTWLYRFDVESFIADIDESLTLRWQDGRVQPLEYRYALEGLMVSNRSRAMNFNWPAGTVNGSYNGDTFTMPLEEGALDPLGFQLQLRQDLKAGKESMSYPVADDGDYDHDRFTVVDSEPLKTEFGILETIKVEKVRGEGSKRETLLWFAPELDYLLVRLVQVEPDGSRYEVTLDKAEIAGR
ncbi:Protein of unknown function [Marinobacter daqiaonensis]|uniref:DUF3108 domain-containing protein n=1 Tax=Marinobacter daqiaonensis TaxID=650891 RepID=A0A1I6GGB1_9GAMM|nr:DUF3108 domain-containing protein [Marinobacter daqiaonensis]SFR41117.1 Protein of unknown function [Marinobacter daqiaonensis]